jgi:general secretion pathway protein E
VIRLQDMGLERYLITSSVNGVLAQRLVRRLCTACKAPVDLDESVLERSGLKRFMGGSTRSQPGGLPGMPPDGLFGADRHPRAVRAGREHAQAIISGADATALHETARKSGMFTLYEDGLRKVAAGETSLEEVLRVTQDQGNA